MTFEEVLKLGLNSVIGPCELCDNAKTCKNILPGFNKPDTCDGPYYVFDESI